MGVRTKKIFLQRSPKVRAEDGLLARRPNKRWKMIMMRKKMVRMRRPLPRRPPVEVVQQAKRRKRQCTRRTVKKRAMEAIQSLRWSRTRGAKMTLIQKLLQRRRRRLPQRRRSLEEREGRKGEGGHQDQRLPRRKSRAQSTTSMTSPTPHSSRRRAPTIPGTRTTDRTLRTPG